MKPKYSVSWFKAVIAIVPLAGALLSSQISIVQASTSTTSSKVPVLAQAGSLAQGTTNAICPTQLGGAIDRITGRSSLRGVRWGVFVQTLDASANRKTLIARNATSFFAPASNNKLFTTAAALRALGTQYRFRTVVYGDRPASNLTSLRIIGQGDPSLTTAQLTFLAQQLRQKGVQQVEQLVGDDTYFRGTPINPNWDAEDTLQGYGAPVNSLMLNQNGIGLTLIPQQVGQPLRVKWGDPTDASSWRISNQSVTVSASSSEYVDAVRVANQRLIRVSGQLRVGSEAEPIAVSIPNPGNYLIDKFRAVLTEANIAVQRATVVKTTPASPGLVELAAVESAPLAQLLIETNRESNNTYAEALLKTLGATRSVGSQDTTNSGIAVIKATLSPLGINAAGYSMVDGSGLASRDRATPEALVQTLQAMAQLPESQVFRDSLAVAGVNGTLKNRFRNTVAQGRLQGKTGTISGVVALSGYLTPPNYPDIAFSILTNYSGASTTTVRGAVDEIVLVLTRLRSC